MKIPLSTWINSDIAKAYDIKDVNGDTTVEAVFVSKKNRVFTINNPGDKGYLMFAGQTIASHNTKTTSVTGRGAGAFSFSNSNGKFSVEYNLAKVVSADDEDSLIPEVEGLFTIQKDKAAYDKKDMESLGGGLGAGAIAGIVIAVIVVIAAIAVAVWFFVFRKKSDDTNNA